MDDHQPQHAVVGHVPSASDLYTAENAAWSAPAVDEVGNRLLVRP